MSKSSCHYSTLRSVWCMLKPESSPPRTSPSPPGRGPSPGGVTVYNGILQHQSGPQSCSTTQLHNPRLFPKKERAPWQPHSPPLLHFILPPSPQQAAASLLRRKPSIMEPSSFLVLHLHVSWPRLSFSRAELLHTSLLSVFTCQVTDQLAVRCRKTKFPHEENRMPQSLSPMHFTFQTSPFCTQEHLPT